MTRIADNSESPVLGRGGDKRSSVKFANLRPFRAPFFRLPRPSRNRPAADNGVVCDH